MTEGLNDFGANEGTVNRRSVRPAEGERRAIIGYSGQYHVAAALILNGLRENRLLWVRVADPDAGRVDDLQVGSEGRVDAYQVKWSQFPGLFTFNDLVSDQGNTPNLLRQLAKGWSQLRKSYPKCRVLVHLLTNETPSNTSQATLPKGNIPPTPSHFAAFLAQVWEPFRACLPDKSFKIPDVWQPAWNAMLGASGLTETDFQAFVRDCVLDFTYRIPFSSDLTTTIEQNYARADIEHIALSLFQIVADPARIIELNRDELIRLLDWTHRFQLVNPHQFPVNEAWYQPIDSSVQELMDAVKKLSGGYITVLGTPGSGKSTLLTKTLRDLNERVFSYYAYVPDAPYPNSLRGESVNFLHDMGIQLEKAGFMVGNSPSRLDRQQLLSRFYDQLELLRRDWEENGRKTIILVDGLDHIEREQNPHQSLLDDLPDPNQIPDGVYFVLGTQTVAPLSAKIRSALSDPGRNIKMQPLDRQQIHEMFTAADFGIPITVEQQDLAYELSNGHPLYLAYLFNRLKQTEDPEQLNELLHGVEVFEGDIVATYNAYWDHFSSDTELIKLLGLFARMRGVIDFSWIKEWADSSSLDRLGNRFAHYFRIENPDRWYFFHNSFRLFLAQKTSEFPAGTPNPTKDRDFHITLADLCGNESAPQVKAWEEIYHRASAAQHAKVLEIATQDYFRSQFLALRPLSAIQTDILVALRSAASCQDSVALARLCLIGSELHQRGYYLEQVDLMPLLLELHDPQIVIDYLRTGNQLHPDALTALKASVTLNNLGLGQESRRLFELAEPLDLLTGPGLQGPVAPDGTATLLRDWAKAAVLFRPINHVIENIREIQHEIDGFDGGDGEDTPLIMQSRLLVHAGIQLLNQQRWADLYELLGAFDLSRHWDLKGWFWLRFHVYRDRETTGDRTKAREHLDAMLSIDSQVLEPYELTILAECTYRLLGDLDRARLLIKGMDQPDVRTELVSLGDGLRPFDHRFRLNRLLYALGDRYSLSEIVPDAGDPRDQSMVLFERDICTVAQIWARAWVGQAMDEATVTIETVPLIRRNSRSSLDVDGGEHRFAIAAQSGDFCSLLIEAVAQHGLSALDGLWRGFEQEWGDVRTASQWSTENRRSVIMAFAREGFQRSWVSERLGELDEVLATSDETSERLEECVNHARAWLEMEEHEKARSFLSLAIEESFGVGYRNDYQVDTWIAWLGRVNELQPDLASKRISECAQVIEALDDSIEKGAVHSAAAGLLGTTYSWSPVRATQLFHWLLDKGLITYQSGLSTLLNAMLESSKPPTIAVVELLSEGLLPFSSRAEPDLMSLVIRRVRESEGENGVLEEARRLVAKVRLWASPSQRPSWLKGLAVGMERLGLSMQDVGVKPSELLESVHHQNVSGNVLKLNDGSGEISREEVENRIGSMADLRELVESEDDGSYFNWVPVAFNLVEQTTLEADLLELAESFRNKRDSSNILACAAIRLNELGFSDQAWILGEEALAVSTEYGWGGFYGNSRISALRALSTIDKTKASPKVFQYLTRDLETNFGIIHSVRSSLDEILELISSPVPVMDIWPEIEKYAAVLLRNELARTPPMIFTDDEIAADTYSRSIIELAAAHVCHPCFAIAQAAQRTLGKLLLQGMPDVSGLLMDCLSRSEGHQEGTLIVLDAVAFTQPAVVSGFRAHVEGLINSPNWLIRSIAGSIMSTCGWDVPTTNRVFQPLPAIYHLLPPQTLIVPLEQIRTSPRATVPDSSDPRLTLNFQIESIAKIADVPVQQLYARVVEIMEELAPPETWSAEAQRRFDSSLRSVGLHLPRAESRFRVARRAMFLCRG